MNIPHVWQRGAFLAISTFLCVIWINELQLIESADFFTKLVSRSIPLMLVALAAGVIISSGKLDLSIGALVGLLGSLLVSRPELFEGNIIIALVLAFVTALLGCTIAALGVAGLRLNALIVTLGLAYIYRGLSLYVQVTTGNGGGFKEMFPFTSEVFQFGTIVGVVGFLWFWRYQSRWGLRHISLGLDEHSARLAGIQPRRVLFLAFVIVSFLAALYPFFFMAIISNGSFSSAHGWGVELAAITAAVIGGCRLSGGTFDPIPIAMAALLIRSLEMLVIKIADKQEYAQIAWGALLILAIIFDSYENRRRAN